MFYFCEIENGYIIGQGANPYGIMAGAEEISSDRYAAIIEAQASCPGDTYLLRADTLVWEIPE